MIHDEGLKSLHAFTRSSTTPWGAFLPERAPQKRRVTERGPPSPQHTANTLCSEVHLSASTKPSITVLAAFGMKQQTIHTNHLRRTRRSVRWLSGVLGAFGVKKQTLGSHVALSRKVQWQREGPASQAVNSTFALDRPRYPKLLGGVDHHIIQNALEGGCGEIFGRKAEGGVRLLKLAQIIDEDGIELAVFA